MINSLGITLAISISIALASSCTTSLLVDFRLPVENRTERPDRTRHSSLDRLPYYNNRLETIKELPRGAVIWQFDQTDMAKAKEALGDIACIAGNVPTSLLVTGTPQDVKKYCRKLIEV